MRVPGPERNNFLKSKGTQTPEEESEGCHYQCWVTEVLGRTEIGLFDMLN